MNDEWPIHFEDEHSNLYAKADGSAWKGWYQPMMFGPVYGWNQHEAIGSWVYYV